MSNSVKENSAAISDFINAEQVKTTVDEVLAAFSDMIKVLLVYKIQKTNQRNFLSHLKKKHLMT